MENKSLTAILIIVAIIMDSTYSAPMQGQVAKLTDTKGKCYEVKKRSLLREKIVPMRCCDMFRERGSCDEMCGDNTKCVQQCLAKPYKICWRLVEKKKVKKQNDKKSDS